MSALRGTRTGLVFVVAFVVVLVVLQAAPITVPGILPGPSNAPGSLQVLSVALIFAALAVTLDLVFGYLGLLPFGHALWFGVGAYMTALLLRELEWNYFVVVLLIAAGVAIVSIPVGLIALRTSGIAFAMVTLAFAQAFVVLVVNDPWDVFGGRDGLSIKGSTLPEMFRGVVNVSNVFWLAVAFFFLTLAVGWQLVHSRAGRVWVAVRENETRVELMGLQPLAFKLVAFCVSAVLASIGGAVYVLVVGGADTSIASPDFSLLLLVMVVLGGAGRLWGAALGGFVFGIAHLRLGSLSASLDDAGLPNWIAGPLGQPEFILGLAFVLVMLFAPGGVAGIVDRVTRRRTTDPAGMQDAGPPAPDLEDLPVGRGL